MRHFLAILFFFYFSLINLGLSAQQNANLDLVSGKVVHIFENFVTDQEPSQLIAKVKLKEPIANNDFALVEINNSQIKVGDNVLLKKIGNFEDFGMGDSFDPSFEYFGFARNSYISFLLFSFLVLFILNNKRTFILTLTIMLNVLFLIFLLPWFINNNIPLIFFLFLFLAANSYLFMKIFPQRKYLYALYSALGSILITIFIYERFAFLAKLHDHQLIQKTIFFGTTIPLNTFDSLALIVSGFYIFIFTTYNFINISYKETIYENFVQATFKLMLFYFFLIIGLTLPLINYYQFNSLGLEYLFNNYEYIKLFSKLAFLFWGNFLCFLLFVIFFYINNKQYFHHYQTTDPSQKKESTFDVSLAIEDERKTKYNEMKVKKKSVQIQKKKKIAPSSSKPPKRKKPPRARYR